MVVQRKWTCSYKMESGMSQKECGVLWDIQEASRSWEKEGNGFFPEPS